jgi:DNA-binding transcriptional ArsR family regulator
MIVKQFGGGMPPLVHPALEDVELTTVLQALADPVRLRLVALLMDGEVRSCAPETWGVEVHKSTLSHHYKVLRDAGITRTHVNGRTRGVELRGAELEERFPGLLEFLRSTASREFPAAVNHPPSTDA